MTKIMFIAPLRVLDWPEADQAAWKAALEDDPLAPGGFGGAAFWRASTVKVTEAGYGLWLAWLQRRGELDNPSSFVVRVTPDLVREFLADMRWAGLSDYSAATRLCGLAAALGAMAPQFDARFITRGAGRVRAGASPARDMASRAIPLDELLRLGCALLERAEEQPDQVARALLFRDGLLIKLLVHRPLRISNMASIEIGRSLQNTRSGYRLHFEAEEMKNKCPYTAVFPPDLVVTLERYLDEFRPVLLERLRHCDSSRALWIGKDGQALKVDSVTAILKRRTLAEFGRASGPHILRHSVATTIAQNSPQNISEVPTILGHKNLQTSERHYIHANAIAAGGQLHEAIAARRKRI